MHTVLQAVDLLRIHNNKPYFKDFKAHAGFLDILGCKEDAGAAAAAAAPAAEGPADIAPQYLELYDLHDRDLYNLAALMATLLLHWRMWQEGVLPSWHPPLLLAGSMPAHSAGQASNGVITSQARLHVRFVLPVQMHARMALSCTDFLRYTIWTQS